MARLSVRWGFVIAAIAAALFACQFGCGGGHSSRVGASGMGTVTIAVAWPQSEGRAIPADTSQVVITLLKNGSTVRRVPLVRQPGQQSASATIENIPAGSMVVRGDAYDSAGMLLASGATSANIAANTTNAVQLTLSATSGAWDPFRITLTWNQSNDLDLHVFFLPEQHSYYGHKAIDIGSLDRDVIDGYGPEHFTASLRMPGTYYVAVNYFGNGSQQTSATVEVETRSGNQTFGPHSLYTPNGNGGYPVRYNSNSWWRVCDIRVYSSGAVTLESPNVSIPLGLGGNYGGYGDYSGRMFVYDVTRGPAKGYQSPTRGMDPSLRRYLPKRGR